jgi:hypothetical protein
MHELSAVEEKTAMMLAAGARGDLELAERHGLALPQVTCTVYHHFAPGFCIREMHIPAGTFLIGHAHKHGLANMFVKGKVRLLNEGVWCELHAPFFFVGKPGRKAALALEDSIWQNIIVTDETDINRIEELFVEKSPQWQAAQASSMGELS